MGERLATDAAAEVGLMLRFPSTQVRLSVRTIPSKPRPRKADTTGAARA
jgi:hypothetical protein